MAYDEQQPSKEELAALELYHQLVNLSPDNGDRALMVTLRLPNGAYVGDVWLSTQDVERMADGAIAINAMAATDPAAAPLPIDDTVTDDEMDDVMAGFEQLLNREGGEYS